ncbi:DUF6603 domain-containing protein [Actinoplanes sp. NPDC049681]|uniref:DUF6603 domain-containing protein n=1 Tax=Actinoplanes sp. NPDC049681 TaxID=3363905 RepID=UPI0037A69DA0
MSGDVWTTLAAEVRDLTLPLAVAAQNEDARRALLIRLGRDPADLSALDPGALAAVPTAADALTELAEAGGRDLGALAELLAQVGEVAAAIDRLGDVGAELLDVVVVEHLARRHPVALQVARLLTLVEDGRIRLDRLIDLLTDPARLLRDHFLGADALSTVDSARAVAARVFDPIGVLLAASGAIVTTGSDVAADPARSLQFLYTLNVAEPSVRLGALLRLLSGQEGVRGVGVTAIGGIAESFETRGLLITLSVTADPGEFVLSGDGVTLPPHAEHLTVEASLARRAQEGRPALLVGSPTGTRLEISRMAVSARFELRGDSRDVALSIELSGGLLAVTGGDDGFLGTVLSGVRIAAPFDIAFDWSLSKGFRMRGTSGLTVDIPVNAELGPVRLGTLTLAVVPDPSALLIDVAGSLSLRLGPFAASVDRLGIRGVLSFPPRSGNLGFAQLDLGIRPPSGAGLAIDSPAVRGGGYLYFDPPAGRYAGVFELTLLGTVSVKVVALITTRLPGGADGFALLLLITAEGFTPVQLGLGFALTGVGGLLALNRTIDADAVRDGLSSGVLDSVLFAKDPVANATQLLATLDRIFPLAADRLLIGPLAEISWGTPAIVKIRLALLLEVPQPLRVVLLAALSLVLPDPDAPVVEVHVDAIGVLDLSRGELALDASLHHSRLWRLTLSGDMAVRLNWGSDPLFVFSIGGFHPRFVPPKGLRRLERLAVSLATGDNPLVRLELYLALTTNTIQLGARLQVRVVFGGFGIDGGGAFDALVQWNPFGLDVAMQAWVRVFTPLGDLFAVRLALQVTGPQPWHFAGRAAVQILFWTFEASVDLTIGDPQPPPVLDKVDVAALIRKELTEAGNWSATLGGRAPGVTLAPPDASATLVHPLATITARQRIAPLETPISRVGALLPTEGTRTYGLVVTAPAGVDVRTATEQYPLAQFTDDLDAETKLRAPAVSPRPGGVTLAAAGAGVPLALAVRTDLTYETLELTSLDAPAVPT